jgi:hypothetical protein
MTSVFVTSETVNTLITLKDIGNLKNLISFDKLTPEL